MWMYSLLGTFCLIAGLWIYRRISRLLNQPSPRVESPQIVPSSPISVGDVIRRRDRMHKKQQHGFTPDELTRLEQLRLRIKSEQLSEF